jgi:cation channel sperm-associated protein 3
MYSLMNYVITDGWMEIQVPLDEVSWWSRIFSIVFIFIGHFIFTNLFIGVIIQVSKEAFFCFFSFFAEY